MDLSIPRFCGAPVTAQQQQMAIDLVNRHPNLSRREVANTLCEWFEWERPNGKPKGQEAVQWLEKLEAQNKLTLPKLKNRGAKGQHRGRIIYPQEAQSKNKADTSQTDKHKQPVTGPLKSLQPIELLRLTTSLQQRQWREQVNRYHYLGVTTPFGASIRYWIISGEKQLGCLQYSSPAWRIQARDQWIGWSDTARKRNLQQLVCNSRFLIFPWVKAPNLASHALSIAKKQMRMDWREQFGITPQMIETMVDINQFQGTCYQAANYICVGNTKGRGRQDRNHQRHGQAVKSIWLLPLAKCAVKKLQD